MAATITETVEQEPSTSELPGDDTALYRISGWALKSTIDLTNKQLKQTSGKAELRHQIAILNFGENLDLKSGRRRKEC